MSDQLISFCSKYFSKNIPCLCEWNIWIRIDLAAFKNLTFDTTKFGGFTCKLTMHAHCCFRLNHIIHNIKTNIAILSAQLYSHFCHLKIHDIWKLT